MEQPSFGFFDPDVPEVLDPGPIGAGRAVADDAAAPDDEATLSVGELTAAVTRAVRRGVPGSVWVRGEVQNLRRLANGNTYFSLVEKAPGRGDRVLARIDVALLRDDRGPVDRALASVPGAELGDDVEVKVRGRLDYYPPQGRLQLRMSAIDPVFTVGDIAAKRARVLRGLEAEGVLGRNRELTLAALPLRVGLVTSVGSAAYHDLVHELETSGYAFRVALVDVRVQGDAASRRIVHGLRQLATLDLDVVVVARGGGSRADLAPFDAELVARAVLAMPVPVIAGVGHEIDRSVIDEVAHTSCKTPTACGQLLVARVRDAVHQLDQAARVVRSRARARTELAARELDEATRRIRRSAPATATRERARVLRTQGRIEELGRRRAREASRELDAHARLVVGHGRRASKAGDRQLDGLVAALAGRAAAVPDEASRGLRTLADRVVERALRHTAHAALRLDTSQATVRALDPRRVLERGYSITRDAGGQVVRDPAHLTVGGLLTTAVSGGRIVSRVEQTEPDAREARDDHDTDDEGAT